MAGLEVYVAHCEVTGKKYVGITSQGISRRWSEHKRDANAGSKTALHRAIRKHGADAFRVEVMSNQPTVEALKQAEVDAIETLNTMAPNGYNLTRGGDGVIGAIMPESWYAAAKARGERLRGVKRLPEIVQKVAAAQKGQKRAPMSDATRECLRLANTGRAKTAEEIQKLSAALTGKPLAPEHCAKLSAAHKGIRLSQEAKDKLSAHWKGRTFSETHLANLSASQKGKTLSPEHLANIRAAQKARRERERAAKELA